ncbi:hypothetical protein VXS75_23470, partial [Escherichia coli]|nr:hypothetical protein [Escherichia coli]
GEKRVFLVILFTSFSGSLVSRISGAVHWYNFEHKHSGIKYVTPAERHQENDMKILAARKAVYQLAREQHPERWGKHLRNWDYISEVYLNPEKEAA